MHPGVLSCVRHFATPWTVAHQAPLSMGFPRQEHWSRLPIPAPGDLPHPGIQPLSPESPALAGRFFYHCATWEAKVRYNHSYLQMKKLGFREDPSPRQWVMEPAFKFKSVQLPEKYSESFCHMTLSESQSPWITNMSVQMGHEVQNQPNLLILE